MCKHLVILIFFWDVLALASCIFLEIFGCIVLYAFSLVDSCLYFAFCIYVIECLVFFGQELEDPLILIHEKKISSINDVVKVLELALKVSITFWQYKS